MDDILFANSIGENCENEFNHYQLQSTNRMIETIIDKNIAFLQRHIQCDENDVEIYKYALRIVYSYIIDILSLMFLAAITNKVLETVIMLVIFAILQVYGGGYHANTKLGCFTIMVARWFIGIFGIAPIMAGHYSVNIIIMVVSTGLVFSFAPVLNEKHPVGSDVYVRSKKAIRISIVTIDVLTVLFIVHELNNMLAIISTIIFLYCTSLVSALCKRHIKRKNDG